MRHAFWPREYKKLQDSLFAGAAEAAGARAHPLRLLPLSLHFFPETWERAREGLRRAKRQPKGKFGQAIKLALLALQYNGARRLFSRNPDSVAMAWNGLTGSRYVFMEAARDLGLVRAYGELAPLTGYLTFDREGVNAAGSARTAPFPERGDTSDALIEALRDHLVPRAPRQPNADAPEEPTLGPRPPFIFVPLQVPRDSQVTLFGGWVESVPNFLEILEAALPHLPEGWQFRIKEHPSAKIRFPAELAALEQRSQGRIHVETTAPTFDLVAESEAVLTLNSSVGFQAFLWHKRVIACGEGFWTRPELCLQAPSQVALHAILQGITAAEVPRQARRDFIAWVTGSYFLPVTSQPDGTVVPDPARLRAILGRDAAR